MTRKTLKQILVFGIAIILATTIVSLSAFYSYSDDQVKKSLVIVEEIVEAEIKESGDYSFINKMTIDGGTRVTLVSSDGTVLADSTKNPAEMENHKSRLEIKEALEKGVSSSVRKSKTLNQNTYYFAKQIDNSMVLRVSTQAKGIVSFASDIALYIGIVIAIMAAAAIFISIGLTKNIVKPIEKLGADLNNISEENTYDELKPFVRKLLEEQEKRRKTDKQKKQFTADVSHELKTPLTSIAGYAELIETGLAREEDIKPFASVIRKQALRLVSLSEDIIRLSQMEDTDETHNISFASIDLYAKAVECVDSLAINAKNKNVTLTLEGSECYIRANDSLLEELIYNLVDNAIRYNRENGSVTVSVCPLENGGRLTVKDTGIGIKKEYQDRIFERFFRVDKSRSKATGGTGLGLAIVKHIVGLHGAELEIDSEIGIGTTITITFNNLNEKNVLKNE